MPEQQLFITQLNPLLKSFLLNRSKEEIVSDEIYLKYPELFIGSFINIKSHQIDLLNIAGYLYYKSVLLMDRLIDDSTENKITPFLLISKLQEESIKYLTTVFELNSPFWELWNKRQQEYFHAIQLEKNIACNPSYKRYQQIADLKAAFGKVAIDCLHILSEEKDKKKYLDLLQSHYHFSVGMQLIDDLQDLEEDLENKQFNWAYYQTITKLKEANYDIDKINISEIKKLIYLKGISTNIRKKALNQFKKSKQFSEPHQTLGWITIIEKKEKEIKHAIDQIEGYLMLITTKIKLQKQPQKNYLLPQISNNNTSIKKGLNYILSEWKQGYSELKHLMYLSALDGFSGKSRIHIGDVFQRAMITNVLLDAQNNLKIDLNNIIEDEVDFLLRNRLKTRVGGWSYYPSCPEIAADADDLGEIMQVFIRNNNINLVEKYCEKPLNILLLDRINKNNGIETWIIPKVNLNKQEKQQIYFNTTKWGIGPDNEVMANFLYSLALYDKEKYNDQILKSCNYLLNQQNKGGYWQSRWYYGNYYGTYTCLRLFKEMNIQNRQTTIAYNYIKKSQNKNGGWGIENISDPLNTAFAILCLKTLNKKVPTTAIEYLYQKQQSNGHWEAVSFIKPRSNEPYKSSTLTTAIVLKALINSNL